VRNRWVDDAVRYSFKGKKFGSILKSVRTTVNTIVDW